MKFKIGDKVCWSGSPGERSTNLHGKIIYIKKGIAFVTHPYAGVDMFAKVFGGNFTKMTKASNVRQVPIKILKKCNELR